MNIDALQAAWQMQDQRLSQLKLINEKLVKDVAAAGSGSVIRTMERQYQALTLLFAAYTLIFIACIAGNPFDYTTALAYLPLVLYALVSLLFLVLVVRARQRIAKISLAGSDLAGSLRLFIAAHENHIQVSRWLERAYVFAGALFPFTFYSRIALHKGAQQAIGVMLVFLLALVILIWVSMRLGLFKDAKGMQLKSHLHALEERLKELEQL